LTATCCWPLGATLGEGPVWSARDAALWFVDIKRRQVHRYDPATGERRSFTAPGQCGFVAPCADGGLVAGVQGGLYRVDAASGHFALHVAVEADRPGNRLNDAAVDPRGYLWFGSMDDAERAATGRFYRLDDDGQVRSRGLECTITNGPAFSPDSRTGYFVDTLARTIWACDIDEQGHLDRQRPFVVLDDTPGFPDGPVLDEDGHLWIGLYGGWGARRYSPAGTLVARVELPVANVTKLAFGGADRRTLFATTAAQGLDAPALARQPLAGGLFTWPAPVRGAAGVEVSHGI
jgi:sugar lactone lactonase YvrE